MPHQSPELARSLAQRRILQRRVDQRLHEILVNANAAEMPGPLFAMASSMAEVVWLF
jgi:hypothetical protein